MHNKVLSGGGGKALSSTPAREGGRAKMFLPRAAFNLAVQKFCWEADDAYLDPPR